MSSGQVCTFWVDSLLFGLDLTEVQEIIRAQRMTRVPLAPAVLRGLIHLRGQIVTALCMRTRLGIPQREDKDPMNVLVRCSRGLRSLLVDQIGDVLEVASTPHEKPPETLSGTLRELVTGVYKLPEGLVLMLDVERLTTLPPEPRTRP